MIDVLTSRYVTPSLLFWACLFGLALSTPPAEPLRPAANRRLRLAAFAGVIFIGVTVQLPKIQYGIDAERYLAEGEYALINNVFAPEAWQRFAWIPGTTINSSQATRVFSTGVSGWTLVISEACDRMARITHSG